MILDDLFEANLPPNIRPSDLPPGMRQKLTMRDVEKERPAGAYRFRVVPGVDGESTRDFLDQQAAQEYAQAVKGRVEPIVRETVDQKKTSNPRIERILKTLRARHPQAEDDLEALIYDFQTQQRQDRRDIGRLGQENDQEEADIDRIEQMLLNLKKQRELAEKRDRSPGKISKSEDPCWSGYHMVGTKQKAGREVPNCVPGKKGAANESEKSTQGIKINRAGPREEPVT
jgi:hypothetical protein